MPHPDRDLSQSKSEGDVNRSSRRDAWQQRAISPETRQLLDEDARYFLHQSLSTPCLNALTESHGTELVDLQGRRYLDFHGNNVHQVGHANPDVIAAVKAQLDEFAFCPRRYTNRPAVDLARLLAERTPGDLAKTLLCPSGTAAIGIALKLARVATGRYKTISMWDAFHGASLDAISVGGEEVFRAGIGPLMPGTEHVPPADEYRCVWDCHRRGGCDLKCADYIDYVLEKEGDVAAVVAEPVRSTPYIPTPAYWQAVRRACDRHGALLIFDEIPHSLGRTGRLFTCENFDVVPDILVLGKGLGGGIMPLAAVVARADLDVAGDRALGHYTHEKSPLAAAAALATFKYLDDHDLVAHTRTLGEKALARMEEMKSRHASIGDVRGLGLLMGIELVTDRASRERNTELAESVMYAALDAGLSFKVSMGNILTLTPPLTISENKLHRAFDILDRAIETTN